MKAQLAYYGIHHIELQGAAPHEDVLHTRRLPSHAPPLRVSFDGPAWTDEERSRFYERVRIETLLNSSLPRAAATPATTSPARWLPADELKIGTFEILRASIEHPEAKPKPSRAMALGLAVSCTAAPAAPAGDGCQSDVAPSSSKWSCAVCTTPSWLGRPAPMVYSGFCDRTEGEGNCKRGQQGAWEMGGAGEATGLLGISACVRKCEACSRCQYVSFSSHHEDCSWFHSCRLDRLQSMPGAETFRTIQVRGIEFNGSSSSSTMVDERVEAPFGAVACPVEETAWRPATAFNGRTKPSQQGGGVVGSCSRDGGERLDGRLLHTYLDMMRGVTKSQELSKLVRLSCAATYNQSLAVARRHDDTEKAATGGGVSERLLGMALRHLGLNQAASRLLDSAIGGVSDNKVRALANQLESAVPAARHFHAACSGTSNLNGFRGGWHNPSSVGQLAEFMLLREARSRLPRRLAKRVVNFKL